MTLATVISHKLQHMGLKVFLDYKELKYGDPIPATIEHSINTASLHIAIFSETYATSPWCLSELCLMLKTGATIVPVFYGVRPSDLRYLDQKEKTGVFADAFREHELKGRYESHRLDEWKQALRTVSFFYGWEHKIHDDAKKLCWSVVYHVLKELKKVLSLEVAPHPVGLDEAVQDFEQKMLGCGEHDQNQSENVKIVGIVGMGGAGKTTLAKELYNRKERLRNRLGRSCSPILIVLDDVDHTDQLDALLVKNVLRSGSLIIITSRDKGVLTRSGISLIYEIKELSEKHARELFCWHAFLHPHPTSGFEDLVEEFLKTCNGLPLSLKVFGGHLYGSNDREYWKDERSKVSRILPTDIKKRLEISYVALDEEEKRIFLDIACFFIGKEKSMAIRIWDGSGWSGLHGLQTLERKCLVELDSGNCLRMHDHLRDLGREIARNEKHPHRLSYPQATSPVCIISCLLLKIQFVFISLNVMRLGILNFISGTSSEYSFRSFHSVLYDTLPKCYQSCMGNPGQTSYVELFVIDDCNAKQRDLLWLSWYNCRRRGIPSWLPFKNLRGLEIFDGKIERLWQYDSQAPFQLREMIIWSNRLRKFPKSIGLLKHLENLVLNGLGRNGSLGTNIGSRDHSNFSLQTLPDEFCDLQSLQHLELLDCRALVLLPLRFGDLTNLQHVNLNGCRKLEMLPDSFNRLTRLQYLDLRGCISLTIKPNIF
eukprot:Gb_23826 [translate_table: standard]